MLTKGSLEGRTLLRSRRPRARFDQTVKMVNTQAKRDEASAQPSLAHETVSIEDDAWDESEPSGLIEADPSRHALSEGPRPRRGAPEQTRARLIRTAAQIFNRVPYWETDTNGLAREAGYSTGTFYRHFKDKREIFIAAYREWVAEEWASIESTVQPGRSPDETIDLAADALIDHHRRWRVFRGNVRALVTYDDELRELTQALRREQLEKMGVLRMLQGLQASRTLESDAVHVMMFERVCDGIADGDFKSIGCSVELAQREFRRLMRQYLLD